MTSESGHIDSAGTRDDHERTWIDHLFPASPRMLHGFVYIFALIIFIFTLHYHYKSQIHIYSPSEVSHYCIIKKNDLLTAMCYRQWLPHKHDSEYDVLIQARVYALREMTHHSTYYNMWSAHNVGISFDSQSPSYWFEDEDSVRSLLPLVIDCYLSDNANKYRFPLDRLEYKIAISRRSMYATAHSGLTGFRILWQGILANIVLSLSVIALPWILICRIRSGKHHVPYKAKQRRKHISRGRCPNCRYQIHHLPTRRCPECGETWTEQENQLINE